MIISEKLVQRTGQVKGNGLNSSYTLRVNAVTYRRR